MPPVATVSSTASSTDLKRVPETVAVTDAVVEAPTSGSTQRELVVLNTIRCLAADLCQQYNGGHPGTAMGAAAIGVALWKYQMRYNPANADWFARDRFVLSAGHASLLQYLLLHFTGYSAWTLDVVKNYHAPVLHGMAAGHPEIEYPGCEVTTGPLGQGIANAVGMAVAGKQMAAQYNRDGYDVVSGKVWCFTGDGCLQEGVGQEAISMAGHWGLDNLILIYDNNKVTVDGGIDSCFTDDTSAKLAATGWHIIEVADGTNNVSGIVQALESAKQVRGKPVLVNIRTVIGHGSSKANTGATHGAALGTDDVAYVKTQLGFNPGAKFVIPPEVYEYFASCAPRGAKLEAEWNDMMVKYAQAYPSESAELQRRIRGELREGWESDLPPKSSLPTAPTPTRKSSGIVLKALVPTDPSFIVGSADLMESTFVSWPGQVEFQNPASGLGNYAGRQVRYGIREFAMTAMGNGLAAYQRGAFIPVMSTFLMFWLYAAPAARMSALQRLRIIGIGTHDGLGLGEDGPTHQPIALPAFYRALPGLNFIRPADAEEVVGAYALALGETNRDRPSLLALSRQAVPLLERSDRAQVTRGAYPVYGPEGASLTLVASGAEVARAISVAEKLAPLAVRVVSMPSQAHFDAQPVSYRRSILPTRDSLVVAIEAWGGYGWTRYAHAGCHMQTFGMSAPQETLYEHFGFGVDNLVSKISAWVQSKRTDDGHWDIPAVGEYDELLLGQVEEKW